MRIESTSNSTFSNVAFSTPVGKKILIVVNNGGADQTFNIKYHGEIATPALLAGAVVTYVW